MKLFKWLQVALLLTFFSSLASAQTCLAGVNETTPDADFFATNSPAYVYHSLTELVWQRCSVGQTFDGEACVGEPRRFTWQQALDYSLGLELDGLTYWRVPNIKELATIVERACVRPAVRAELFPQTEMAPYWSASPSVANPSTTWAVDFINGTSSFYPRDRDLFLRLVRNRLPNENFQE